jgi:Flp pilus assembly protein TadG
MNRKGETMLGQSLVEFALTIGALMVLVVGTAQVAIYLHYRNSLALACREGAFQAALAGHTTTDGQLATLDFWQKLEPQATAINLGVTQTNGLIMISAHGWAPAIVPVPVPPFTRLPIAIQCVHTVERFQPGSSP